MLLLLAGLSGAADAPDQPTGPPSSVVDAYKIGAGDVLQVQIYGEAALSGSFPVNTQGFLEFPLVGAVAVRGLTTEEVVALLRSRLMDGYLRSPNINVWVSSYRSQPVQVVGAVAKPGIYFLQGPTTVLEVLSEAGGVSQTGVTEVRVTRGGEGDAAIVMPYEDLLSQQAGDLLLTAGDIVFVPQSKVSVMGQVGKPGEIPYRDDLTVSLCIAAAGGALPTAALGQVYILRGEQRISVNLRRILSGKAPDVVVKPGDRIVVQQSAV